nr:polysaccharide lyase family 8 super-sandwich domain-containing protein [uncultured Vibrio sp.]
MVKTIQENNKPHTERLPAKGSFDTNTQKAAMHTAIDELNGKLCRELLSQSEPDFSLVDCIALQDTQGKWRDIEYLPVSGALWPAFAHYSRLLQLLKHHVLSPTQQSEHCIEKSIGYCAHIVKPSQSWWWNDVGLPQMAGHIVCLLSRYLPKINAQTLNQSLSQQLAQTFKTGANRVDIAYAFLLTGIATNNTDIVASAIKEIESSIFVSVDEGIQPDFSFHQHGAQLYMGGYAEAFLSKTLLVAFLAHQSPWQFSAQKVRVLYQLMTEGFSWMNYRDTIDFNVLGRGIARLARAHHNTRKHLKYLASMLPEHHLHLDQQLDHLAGGASPLKGFKHFRRSDYSSWQTGHGFIGIKMNSSRTKPTESGNLENLKGYWLGFGSTHIACHGNEYRGIFPAWDWRKIPGVTAPNKTWQPAEWGTIEQPDSHWVGGLTTPLGGGSTMQLDVLLPDGSKLTGQKTWFVIDEVMIALGVNLSHPEPLCTTINQCLATEHCLVDGHKVDAPLDQYPVHQHLLHDGVNYLLLDDSQAELKIETQTGSWHSINANDGKETVELRVITLVIKEQSRYAYAVSFDSQITHQLIENRRFTVSNTESAQWVWDTQTRRLLLVCHTSQQIDITDSLSVYIEGAGFIMYDQASGQMWLSTPGEGNKPVRVHVTQQKDTTMYHAHPSGDTSLLGQTVAMEIVK